MLSAAWLAGVLLGLSSGLATAALLLAGAAGLVAVGLRLARLPAFPALLAAVLLLGLAWAEASQAAGSAPDALAGREVAAVGRIADDPESTATRVRFELQVSQVLLNGESRDVSERWLVYANPPDDVVARREAPFFRYGDAVTVQGMPQEPQPIDGFDYPAYLAAQGITATLFAQETQVTGEGGTRWRAALYTARQRLADSIERAMPFPESAVATAMLLGKRETLAPELVDKFRGTGAAHLLAISGLHVGVLLAVTSGAAGWLLGRQRPTYLVVAAVAIWLYALTAGASPSALRAAVMGTVYLAALGLGRPSGVLPALALAAAVMTAASPGLIRQVSFQLSFAAVGGIALALAMFGVSFNWRGSSSAGWIRRTAGWATALAVVSAAASLATWPLVAANFGQVALLGVPVSLLTVPAMAPLAGGGGWWAGIRPSGSAAGLGSGGPGDLGDRRGVGLPVLDGGGGLGGPSAATGVVRRTGAGAAGGATRASGPHWRSGEVASADARRRGVSIWRDRDCQAPTSPSRQPSRWASPPPSCGRD